MSTFMDLVRTLLDRALGTDPGRCNTRLYQDGVQVLMLAGPRSWLIERFVVEARRRARVPLDWHMHAGRAVVLALPGDEEKAIAALEWWLPALEEAARQEVARVKGTDEWAGELTVIARARPRPPRMDKLPPGAIAVDADGTIYVDESVLGGQA